MAKELHEQPLWTGLGLEDLRHVAQDDPRVLEDCKVEAAGDDEIEALARLEEALGMASQIDELECMTPVGAILIARQHLAHIVEKRIDARERFVHFALAAMKSPFEVWKVAYDDGSFRLAFIGLFSGKRHMLVIATNEGRRTLWNFMHTDKKSLNKHRHGELLYQAKPLPSIQ